MKSTPIRKPVHMKGFSTTRPLNLTCEQATRLCGSILSIFVGGACSRTGFQFEPGRSFVWAVWLQCNVERSCHGFASCLEGRHRAQQPFAVQAQRSRPPPLRTPGSPFARRRKEQILREMDGKTCQGLTTLCVYLSPQPEARSQGKYSQSPLYPSVGEVSRQDHFL